MVVWICLQETSVAAAKQIFCPKTRVRRKCPATGHLACSRYTVCVLQRAKINHKALEGMLEKLLLQLRLPTTSARLLASPTFTPQMCSSPHPFLLLFPCTLQLWPIIAASQQQWLWRMTWAVLP